MDKILFITWNQNKFKEASLNLPWYDLEMLEIELPEIQSTDVNEVIKYKLKTAYSQINKPCFVMDASLIIEWLCDQNLQNKTFPWALIKDVFLSMWAENITKLVEITKNRNCTWKAMIWYFDSKNEYFFQADMPWYISDKPRWNNWYNWDTIFIPNSETKTFAEMTFDEKHSYALTKDLYKKFKYFLDNKT